MDDELNSSKVPGDAFAGCRLRDCAAGEVGVELTNLLELEDRSMQLVLKEIDSESLIIALKGAPQELREKFLNNMSQRAAEALREDIEMRGPVRVSQVEKEQKSILLVVRRLADAGELVIGGKGNDAYV